MVGWNISRLIFFGRVTTEPRSEKKKNAINEFIDLKTGLGSISSSYIDGNGRRHENNFVDFKQD